MSAGSLVCSRDHCRACNEIPKGRAVTDRDSLTETHSLAISQHLMQVEEQRLAQIESDTALAQEEQRLAQVESDAALARRMQSR